MAKVPSVETSFMDGPQLNLPYARHYKPRFVYFYPIFEGKKRFFKDFFRKFLTLCKVSIQERFLIKSGL